MAECKDCIHYDMCKYRPLAIGVDICDVFRNTADVVPKSEVEELREINSLLAAAGLAWQKHYENLAREIFEEIEELAKIYTFPVVKNGVIEIIKEPFWCIEPSDLAELKKKYTEEKKDEN